ncbi:TonB-dependent receptor [Tardiphaga sp.]|uniref:TonB-dependent receptor n=1 Tax=Tardiphaga sp. TaxID=1926292 RepID=UPI002629F088|nr:TonB-dependent receptor [Tardiphaga sp.]MDB5616562.1 TonB-dependent receptor [Tardiphaga sp.]
MSSVPTAAQRRRILLASTILLTSLSLPVASAFAQQNPAQQGSALPAINVTASRLSTGIVGASTSVISAEDIARSPAQTVQEIIAQTPGVQLQNLYGGVNGAATSVDLRGFGAFATSNTLVLINGRRLNDLDMAGVDLSTIPRDSIERIEITRGNSGAVLYGDDAVGGVINIVTKTGSAKPLSMRVEGGAGSFGQQLGSVSVAANAGPWSSSFYGSGIRSDGYRDNNALTQHTGIGDIRYATPEFSAFLTLSGDRQHLGLPGGRTVDPSIGLNQLLTDRRGTSTPLDYADKQGLNVTAGFTKTLWSGAELIVDGGVRNKDQQAGYFGSLPLSSFAASYVDTSLQTWSLTPRLSIKNQLFGLPSDVLTGIDFNDATYHSNRSQLQGTAPTHVYDLSQQTLSAYWQQTVGLLPSTDVSYGGRIQQTRLSARDRFDINAPGAFDAQALPLNSEQTQHALHVGIEHRINDVFAVFGRAASAYRTPNVDELVASGPSFAADFSPIPGTFTLKTQTSRDIEAGFRIKAGAFNAQSSIYGMDLENEIHYNPVLFYNTNLDPTRRYGSETSASLRTSDTVLLRGGLALTRAVFREGEFAGHDVPLVSRLTASGGVTWNVWEKYVVVDATVRYWSSRRMDNDQLNTQPVIPANATVDLKISGEIEHFFWSLAVNNLLDAQYYDYAIASTFTAGRFNAYPLPGRSYMVRAGATF